MWLAWKEMKHNKKNYGLIGIAIVRMLFMVIFLSGLTNGLARAVSAGVENINVNYFAISDTSEDMIAASSLSQDEVNEVSDEFSGATQPIDIQRSYVSVENSDEKENIAYFGINPNGFINPDVTEGSKLGDEENTIVLNVDMKDKGISIGDKIIDSASDIKLTVIGFTKDAYYCHVSAGYVSFKTYENIQKAINPYYTEKFNAGAINSANADNVNLDRIKIVDKQTVIDNLPGYSAEKDTINMIIWVLVVITGAILAVFFYIITIQKRKQYGVMKALGMKNSEIAKIIVEEVTLLSCIGSVCGIILAYGLSLVLPSAMPFYFKISDAIIIAVVFVLISILGSLLSVIKVAKVDPLITIGGAE